MNTSTKAVGLREQIAAAQTVRDVRALLAHGLENFHLASFKTVRQWQVAATRRIKELEAAAPAPAPAPAPVAPVSNGRAERRRARRAAKMTGGS